MPNIRLDSWKSIAGYLGRGVRTVQRWHENFGMPVHHFGGTRGCVFAYSEDLDRWLASSSENSASGHPGEDVMREAGKARARQAAASAEAMWELRSEGNIASITSLYRSAVDEDPENTTALVGLARALITGALFGVVDGFVAYPSAQEALRRVPRPNSEDSEAQCAGAWLKMSCEHRWREARAEFEDVLARRPDDAYALAGRALLYITEGKLPEAFHNAWQAWSRNPLAAPLSFLPCWIQYLNGDYEEALSLLANARASGGYGALHATVEMLTLSQAVPGPANLKPIREVALLFPQNPLLEGLLGYSYAAAGHPGKAWEILGQMMQHGGRKRHNTSYVLGLVLLGLGEKREALACLESAFAEGSLWSLGFHADPILRPLHGDRRFEALLHRIGPTDRIPDALAHVALPPPGNGHAEKPGETGADLPLQTPPLPFDA